LALAVAGFWSVGQLVLGIAWLMGWDVLLSNPFDPLFDVGGAAPHCSQGSVRMVRRWR
jgi:hypothetical protein